MLLGTFNNISQNIFINLKSIYLGQKSISSDFHLLRSSPKKTTKNKKIELSPWVVLSNNIIWWNKDLRIYFKKVLF